MSSVPHWHVLGAGAIGSLLTQQLMASDCDCTLLHHQKGKQLRVVASNGLRSQITAHAASELAEATIHRLLVTTKAGQVRAALALVANSLAEEAVVLCTANGLGFENTVRQQQPSLRLHRAVSTAAAYRDNQGTVHAAATGITRVGWPGEETATPAWFEDSLRRLEGWSWTANIDGYLGEKFALNCAINPLTAVQRCRNGELLDRPDALRQLCREIEPALRELGLWQRQDSLFDAAAQLCRATTRNHSSMLQDVLAGRSTEIAFLNGELDRRAAAIGLSLPLNAQLVARLSSSS